jgi:hypothetical protein
MSNPHLFSKSTTTLRISKISHSTGLDSPANTKRSRGGLRNLHKSYKNSISKMSKSLDNHSALVTSMRSLEQAGTLRIVMMMTIAVGG